MLLEAKKLHKEIQELAFEICKIQKAIEQLANCNVRSTKIVVVELHHLASVYSKEKVKHQKRLKIIQFECQHEWEYELLTHRCIHCGLTTEY